MVIDFHTHNFPDSLAPKALEVLTRHIDGEFLPIADATVSSQLRDMDKFGVDVSVVCPIATKVPQFDVILRRSIAVREGAEGEEAAKRLVFLASVHPLDPDCVAHVHEVAEAGIRGIVIHPYYQGVRLDDPAVVRMLAAARDDGLFAMSHCGNELSYPGAPLLCGPTEVETVLKSVPGLTFVACHLGGFDGSPTHAVDRLLPYENCYIDTARIANQDNDPEADRIVREWPAARILFGSDYFWRDERMLLDWVKNARPDESERDLIFHRNAERILGI